MLELMIYRLCSDLPEVTVSATSMPTVKLESLVVMLKASCKQNQTVLAEFEQHIVEMKMKLQQETSLEVESQCMVEVKATTSNVLATVTECGALLDEAMGV